jgi:uncharacterized protein (DUF2267 family)
MATRGFESLTDKASLTVEDFDARLKYTGASVARMIWGTSGLREEIQYTSGSGSEGKADSTDLYPFDQLYKNIVSLKPTHDPMKLVKQCLDDSIDVLDAVLDAYDEEVERETLLNRLKEKIEDLWGQRDRYDKNFLDRVVQLKVVSRIVDHEVLSETQVESLKKVFSLLKKIDITKEDRLHCWKILEGSGIDLNAPIRGSENFELVLREKQHRK